MISPPHFPACVGRLVFRNNRIQNRDSNAHEFHWAHIRKAQPHLAIEISHYVRVREWFEHGEPVVVVRVDAVRGSAPRDNDAVMSVTASALAGTIGGGQLEWLAIEKARALITGSGKAASLEVPLGPEIGQCCGGRVRLDFQMVDAALIGELEIQAKAQQHGLPQVLVFGAGHTGKALARALAPLPLATMLIDTRAEALAGFDHPGSMVISAMPESEIRQAPPNSAFVAMTHSHGLDFLITAEALARGDASYCGMIGSATKRAVFCSWLTENGYDKSLGEKLTCPIGGSTVRDKRPEVIAALTAAEILTALSADKLSQVKR
ncbi:MAG: xanthine dehydrogenase accessory protein XdhC [Nitratireductor sp.]